MAFEMWLGYAVAATVIIIIPGPTILLVIVQSLIHSRRSALPLVLGVTCGDAVAVGLSITGLGALLAASSTLFVLVKWVGAAYLIYLGVSLWRDKGGKIARNAHNARNARNAHAPPPTASPRKLFLHAFFVTTFNPKGIIFFIAFLPQFVNPDSNVSAQLFILAATFVVLGSINASLYAIFADKLKAFLENNKARRWFNRCGGTALVAAGAWAATAQRA